MKFYLGVTNNSWFQFLAALQPEDLNFWQPGGSTSFKRLSPGEPFLFKLKSPVNKIGGLGFYSSQTFLPLTMAWEVFGVKNGCSTYSEFQRLIISNRTDKANPNPVIGCIVLTNPVFFQEEDWLDIPENWSSSIVQGKVYGDDEVGSRLWKAIEALLPKYLPHSNEGAKSQLILEDTESLRYGNSVLTRVRLGQSAFRILVTDAYLRRCSITGEKTLPVLEAAHIKPYALSGPHFISNGLLLRSDLHKLFDIGYITITPKYDIEVSKRIKEEFQNGREYYRYHGKKLSQLPSREKDHPNPEFLAWHNSNFRG